MVFDHVEVVPRVGIGNFYHASTGSSTGTGTETDTTMYIGSATSDGAAYTGASTGSLFPQRAGC